MSKPNQKKRNGRGRLIALILVVTVGVVAVMASSFLPPMTFPWSPETTVAPLRTEPVVTVPIQSVRIELEEQQDPINLGHGLEITDAGRYTGIYMEDGSDEIVSDVMMIVVRNGSDSDFQYGRISAVCEGLSYSFTLSNLGAGEQVVLLDQDRKACAGEVLTSAVLEDPVLFQEPMDTMEDVIRVSGLDGMLNIQNISDSDITGDVYVYYKYAAQDIFYGGITFRVLVEGGLKAGEVRQVPASHYSPEGCAIVQVTVHG